jgi:hypothetical protein
LRKESQYSKIEEFESMSDSNSAPRSKNTKP